MFVSIVVPTLNEEKYIGNLLDSIQSQEYERELFEVIVVDSGNDKTLDIAKKFASSIDIKTLRTEVGTGTARNIGAKAAKGEIILFADADVKLPPNILKETVYELRNNKNLTSLAFPILPSRNSCAANIPWVVNNFLSKYSTRCTKSPYIVATCCAYRKSLFERLKFVDGVGEDIKFSTQSGKFGRSKYMKDLVVYGDPRRYEKYGLTKATIHYWKGFILTTIMHIKGLLNSV